MTSNTSLSPEKTRLFTGYETFLIALLAIVQFTIVIDFMVLSPLGAILIGELNITPRQFGAVVSAYAFSAGISGVLTAGFADKFDRKRILLFFYAGFILGTLFCGLAPDYHALLIARIVTGLFGGVMGSVSFAIITDLFPMQKRGRVMGYVQMAFAVSQVLGLPFGLYVATHFNWHTPFHIIVGLSVVVWIIAIFQLRPVVDHLKLQHNDHPFVRLWKTFTNPRNLRGFSATTLLATGGYMLMPFGSAFCVYNLGINTDHLPMVYLVTGIANIFFGPFAGRMTDRFGAYRVFVIGTLIFSAVILVYTRFGITPLWIVILTNVIVFAGISGRIVAVQTMLSAIPSPRERGAFMSLNASIQQGSGGVAAMLAGLIVIQQGNGPLQHYDWLGLIVIGFAFITLFLMYRIHRMLKLEPAVQSVIK